MGTLVTGQEPWWRRSASPSLDSRRRLSPLGLLREVRDGAFGPDYQRSTFRKGTDGVEGEALLLLPVDAVGIVRPAEVEDEVFSHDEKTLWRDWLGQPFPHPFLGLLFGLLPEGCSIHLLVVGHSGKVCLRMQFGERPRLAAILSEGQVGAVVVGTFVVAAGDDTAVPFSIGTDLAGHPRYVNDRQTPDTGVAANMHPVVDIGCYEFQVPGCAADIAPAGGDGRVGIDDLLLVLSQWGTAGGYGPADLSPTGGDGVVNMADLLVVINAWSACP